MAATGTGLPLPQSSPVAAQAAQGVSADSLSSAAAWTSIASSGAKIAEAGFNTLERDAHLRQAGAVADFETSHADWYTKAKDEYHGDPVGFENAARAHNDGAMSELPEWMVPHAKKYLGAHLQSGIGQQLTVKRSNDDSNATQALDARLKMADGDIQEISSSGRLGAPEGKAAVEVYNGVLDTAVNTGRFPKEKADLLREDMALRSQGNAIRSGLEQVYKEKGFDGAREWLQGTVKDLGAQYKFSDRIEKAGLAWLRSEESQYKGERDAIGREWTTAKGQISTLSPEYVADLQDRAYSTGSMKVASDIADHVAAINVTKLIRNLPVSEQMNIARSGNIGATLMSRESSGNPKAVNDLGFAGLYQFGAPRLAALGVYTPGQNENLGGWNKSPKDAPGKWSGTFNIPGFPDVKTLPDFLANPDAQKAAFQAHSTKMDQEIGSLGLDKYIGQTVGGVQITQDGLKSMIHLAGAGGAQAFLVSGGTDNRADANGTKVSDYARLGGANDLTGSRSGLIALGMVKKDLAKDLGGKIDRLGASINKVEFPPLEEITAIGSQADLLGNEEQRRKVAEYGAIAEYGRGFSQLPAAKRSELISAWDAKLKGSGSEYERSLRNTLQTADTKISEQYKTDPYGASYRFSTGMGALPTIDFTSKDAPAVLATKVQQQNQIRADQNMPPFSALRPDESGALAVLLTKGEPQAASNALQMLSALPPDIYKATIADPHVKDALDGMVRSYDPMRLNLAMSTMDRQWRDDPVGFSQTFGGETVKRLQTWQAHKDALPSDQMAELFKRSDDPALHSAREKLLKDAEEKVKSTKPSDVAIAMGSSFGVTPAIVSQGVLGSDPYAPTDALQGARLVAEYEKIFKERYVDTGDADKSKAQAVERLKTVWGPSVIGGGALMRHPPERYYPQVDGSTDWMAKDLEKSIEAYTKTPRIMAAPDTSATGGGIPSAPRENWNYKLMPDQQTEADVAAKQPPSYVVAVTDAKTGRQDIPIGTDGKAMRYRFDPTSAQDEARAKFAAKHSSSVAGQEAVDGYPYSPGIGGP